MRYSELRAAFRDAGIHQAEIAAEINLSETSMCHRMQGRYPFTLTEAYAILDILNRPYTDLPRLFPKDGAAVNAPTPIADSTISWLETFTDDIKRTVDTRLAMARAAISAPPPPPVPIPIQGR